MATTLGSIYLIAGDADGKVATAIERLRRRAEREAGPGSLERIPTRPDGGLDVEALELSASMLSLTAEHRYLLADGAHRLTAEPIRTLGSLLAGMPDDITLVLVCRGKPKPGLLKAVEAAEGEVLLYEAPKRKELPGWLAAEASRRGFELGSDGARALIDRIGERTGRLASELDRLAIWAEPGEGVDRDAIAASVADDSESAVWTLSDAIIERRAAEACRVLEQLLEDGTAATPIIYGIAKSLREAIEVAARLREGEAPAAVQSSLQMHPYRAKLLVGKLRGTDPDDLREALVALSDAEWQTRGGSERDDAATLVMAVRRACGVGLARV